MPEQKKDLGVAAMSDALTIGALNARIQELEKENAGLKEELAAVEGSRENNLRWAISAESVLNELASIQDQLERARDLRLDSRQVDDLRSRFHAILGGQR